MFGDNILTFDVAEVPRRNNFHTRRKNQNRSILALSQIVRHRCRRFCREFELLSRDAPTSNLIMIFVQHLDSTGYHVCTPHNADKGGSAVTMSQANIDAVRESVAASLKKSCRHRSEELGHSHALLLVVVYLPLVDIM